MAIFSGIAGMGTEMILLVLFKNRWFLEYNPGMLAGIFC
jgi:hypothetical protein